VTSKDDGCVWVQRDDMTFLSPFPRHDNLSVAPFFVPFTCLTSKVGGSVVAKVHEVPYEF
jgi:hypothetical protein